MLVITNEALLEYVYEAQDLLLTVNQHKFQSAYKIDSHNFTENFIAKDLRMTDMQSTFNYFICSQNIESYIVRY